jgi:hypothetical protein
MGGEPKTKHLWYVTVCIWTRDTVDRTSKLQSYYLGLCVPPICASSTLPSNIHSTPLTVSYVVDQDHSLVVVDFLGVWLDETPEGVLFDHDCPFKH